MEKAHSIPNEHSKKNRGEKKLHFLEVFQLLASKSLDLLALHSVSHVREDHVEDLLSSSFCSSPKRFKRSKNVKEGSYVLE